MATLVLKSNAATVTAVLVGDLGIEVPPAGGTVTLSNLDELWEAAQSFDLITLVQDDVFGAGSSTLILNDGTSDIDQALADEFLDTAFLTRAGPYGAALLNAQGEFLAANVTFVDNPGIGATDVQAALEVVEDRLETVENTALVEATHDDLDTLVHALAENSVTVVTRDGIGRASNVTTYTNGTLTTKIRECQVTYVDAFSRRPQETVDIQYDGAGDEVERLTRTYAYNGIKLDQITTVKA